MWCKFALLVSISLGMFCIANTSNGQDPVLRKRTLNRANPPTTLPGMFKLLLELEQRVMAVESRRENLIRGRDGRDGMPGKPGKDGHDGKDGRDGKDGSPGPRGPPGLKGEHGIKGVRGQPGPKSGGVQYVRWGRTTCPQNATLIYKGRVGGEHYSHKGGGANYVCLPENPKYGRYKDGHQDAGYMFGAEYQVNAYSPFIKSNLHDHDVPCAACYIKTRNAKMMIPATFECPAEWTREYRGYLMSDYHNHPHPTQFICVDENAEAVPGTHADRNGALLYPVEGRCGSLPCLPYVDGRELTCAVCTK